MQIDDTTHNPTEAIMSDTTTTTLRYGYQPSAAFASTRAGAARRAREAATTAKSSSRRPSDVPNLPRRIVAFFVAVSGHPR